MFSLEPPTDTFYLKYFYLPRICSPQHLRGYRVPDSCPYQCKATLPTLRDPSYPRSANLNSSEGVVSILPHCTEEHLDRF